MPHREVLTHEDDLFGRVALFNNLVTLDQIVECARVISAEIVAGRPRRSLANVLIEHGYLSPARAGSVEVALRKRAAEERRAAVQGSAPTPKPKPMRKRAEPGKSQMVVAVEPEPSGGDAEAHLREIVARIAPGRIYPEMLEHIHRHDVEVIDAKDMAKAIGEPAKAVLAALGRWRKAGLVQKAAARAYFFSPDDDTRGEIDVFLEAWRDPARHAKVLGYILAEEK